MTIERVLGRVLVVDDHENWQATLRRVISRAGYAVEVTSSREKALARLKVSVFDLVVVDLVLEGDPPRTFEGVELLQDIVPIRHREGTQIASITGYPVPSHVQGQLTRLGVVARLNKEPWDRDTVIDAVRHGVELAKTARSGNSDSTEDQHQQNEV